MGITFGRSIHAFGTHRDDPGFAERYLNSADQPLSIVKMTLGQAVLALADGLIVSHPITIFVTTRIHVPRSLGSTDLYYLGQES